jgi:two-component system, sensor histidine kinase LadS
MIFRDMFSGIAEDAFSEIFATEEDCLKYLASLKWDKDFICKKCGHNNFCSGKTPYSRRCTRCKHDESATAHTPFHGCRMPMLMAFQMAYQVCCRPAISTYKLSQIFDIRQMTCWKLKRKILICINDSSSAKQSVSENHFIDVAD